MTAQDDRVKIELHQAILDYLVENIENQTDQTGHLALKLICMSVGADSPSDVADSAEWANKLKSGDSTVYVPALLSFDYKKASSASELLNLLLSLTYACLQPYFMMPLSYQHINDAFNDLKAKLQQVQPAPTHEKMIKTLSQLLSCYEED